MYCGVEVTRRFFAGASSGIGHVQLSQREVDPASEGSGGGGRGRGKQRGDGKEGNEGHRKGREEKRVRGREGKETKETKAKEREEKRREREREGQETKGEGRGSERHIRTHICSSDETTTRREVVRGSTCSSNTPWHGRSGTK